MVRKVVKNNQQSLSLSLSLGFFHPKKKNEREGKEKKKKKTKNVRFWYRDVGRTEKEGFKLWDSSNGLYKDEINESRIVIIASC